MQNLSNPLIVQSDMSVLLEVMNPLFEEARDVLNSFAELQKSPEYMHTYKITPLSLWNAAGSGVTTEMAIESLRKYAKHEIPEIVATTIEDYGRRYGKIRLIEEGGSFYLDCADDDVLAEARSALKSPAGERIRVSQAFRGEAKQILLKIGYPVMDLAGYAQASPFQISLNSHLRLRWYQTEAAEAFHAGGSVTGGSGVIVLPCGAGKTVVGMAVMEKVNAEVLVLTTGITALRQWRDELLDKTLLGVEDIGEYSGEVKEIKPVTITTYQTLTQRRDKNSPFIHFEIFNKRNWGLIIYDEVHMLPAPVFRVTSEIQSKRRLGLTATLVREDGLETDVFSLIGSKKYDLPWKSLEKAGYIAEAFCTEVRVALSPEERYQYAIAEKRNKFRIAAENTNKLKALSALLQKHKDDNVLIIGQYIDQVKHISTELNVPLITGSTKNTERERIYAAFKSGELKTIVVSKVANFAIDLPDANVAIEMSGAFGSRQEEAQRLGRILRPKPDDNRAWFYAIVSEDSIEMDFSAKRQMFLTEQGYKYSIDRYEI
ncbi:MAG: DEAD/DEAH box helicase [Methanomicrobiales archaeon]|jgi:DNA excision repair protein ERCC-3|nr:DEAD/DEAH box helicase [Methanomicrobiales archaeon]